MEALIHAHGLTKRFDGRTAVDGIDLDIARGEAFGFLGPNGAGKTSTMRMIGCVSPVTGGALQVLGMDPAADGSRIRALLGVVPQDNALDVNLTVRDNLHIYGRYFGLSRHAVRERAAELLEFVHLTDRADDRVDALSGGMRRRLAIARSLINEPEILLLDEPTTGLDPQARHLLWDRLFRLKQRGVTLVLTTHYPLSEYAPELRVLVQVTPLYQGIELLRALTTGTVGPGLLGHVAYLAAMGAISLRVATQRLERRLRI